MSEDKKTDSNEFKHEPPPAVVVESEITVMEIAAFVPPEITKDVMAMFDTNQDGAISAQEAKANNAHESLFKVLTKLGASPDDLALVLGIEPKAVREKRQEEDRAWKEKMRKDWEKGQDFDRSERERMNKEAEAKAKAEREAKEKAERDAYKGSVKVENLAIRSEAGTFYLSADVNNTSKAAATIKISVGGVMKGDRTVAAGKSIKLEYTTVTKTGFKGKQMLVGHVEAGVTIFDKVL